MKKIVLFSALATILCAFMTINYKKMAAATVVKPEVVLAEPPPMDEWESPEWKDYEKVVAKEKNQPPVEATFQELLKLFPKGNLPYNLTANVLRERVDSMAKMDYSASRKELKNILPRSFQTFFPALNRGSKFSRMPPPLGEAVLAFEAKEKHILVYFTRYSRERTYYVTTFDPKGQRISERELGNVGLTELTAATLDENLDLTRTSYEVLWDKEPDANGYKDNKTKGLKLTKKTVESLLKKDSQKAVKLEKELVQRANP